MNYKLVKRHRAQVNIFKESFICNHCKVRKHMRHYAGDFTCIECMVEHIREVVANAKDYFISPEWVEKYQELARDAHD